MQGKENFFQFWRREKADIKKCRIRHLNGSIQHLVVRPF
jgi:hypothetical protein